MTNTKKAARIAILLLLLIATMAALGALIIYYGAVLTDNIGAIHAATDVADLDGDGDLDVLLHNVRQESEFTAFSVGTIWSNQGNGRFTASELAQYNHQGGGWASAAGDADRDGDNDVVTFMGTNLRWRWNQGGVQNGQNGAFHIGPAIAGPARAGQYGSVLLGHLNNDNLVDGVVVGCCGRLFTIDPENHVPNVSGVWLNEWREQTQTGALTPLPGLSELAVQAAALGDVDNDGDLDLFAAVIAPPESKNQNPADRILLNDGQGAFTDSGQRLGDWNSTAVALGDIDGDGDLDALVGAGSGVHVWRNQGSAQASATGTFTLDSQTLDQVQTRAIFLADLDGDGDADALLAGQRRAAIWWNDGGGAFTEAQQSFRYSRKSGVALGDFNGDGRLDIFAAAYDNSHRLWLNQGDGVFR